MDEKLSGFLNDKFSAYEDSQPIRELKEELFGNLKEKLADFKNQGYDDETALKNTIASFGDISELLENIPVQSKTLLEIADKNFSDADLHKADLKRIKVQFGKFENSTFKGA